MSNRTSNFDNGMGVYINDNYDWLIYTGSRSSSTDIVDITTGKFQAPIDGTYAFSFQALSVSKVITILKKRAERCHALARCREHLNFWAFLELLRKSKQKFKSC